MILREQGKTVSWKKGRRESPHHRVGFLLVLLGARHRGRGRRYCALTAEGVDVKKDQVRSGI